MGWPPKVIEVMPDDLIREIASLANVADAMLPKLGLGLRLTWEIAAGTIPNASRLKHVSTTAQRLRSQLASLTERDHRRLALDAFPLADYQAATDYLADEYLPRRRRSGGRPSVHHNYPFALFVHRLLQDVSEAGGRLTFDKNYQRGSLVDALKVLAPHLAIIPKRMPYSTIERIKNNWTKNRKK